MIDPVLAEVVADFVKHEAGMTVKAPKFQWAFPVPPQGPTLAEKFLTWTKDSPIRKLFGGVDK